MKKIPFHAIEYVEVTSEVTEVEKTNDCGEEVSYKQKLNSVEINTFGGTSVSISDVVGKTIASGVLSALNGTSPAITIPDVSSGGSAVCEAVCCDAQVC